MSIIDQIYENRIDEECRLDSERKLDREIHVMLRREGYDVEEKLSNLFFEASGCGQQEGFRAGFRIAVALLVECLG